MPEARPSRWLRADSTITYDPTGSVALGVLNTGQHAADTFTYTVTDVLGATSTATVTLRVGGATNTQQLLANPSFEQRQTTSGGAWASFATLPGWPTTNPGSAALEVVYAGLLGVFGDGHGLDSKASPGSIDIGQTVDLATGAELT